MKRIKLKDRILPTYSKGEEIFNMTSHIVGAALGIIAMVLCIIFSAIHQDAYAVVSSVIYGITMICLYTMSSIYHGLSPKTTAKKVFQVLDHCTIFLLIAGSYTPFALVLFREYNPILGWSIFGAMWAIAVLGIVLNSIDLKKYRVFSMICYLAMGWAIIFRIDLLPKLLDPIGLALLVLGGVSYTIGAILYGIGRKKKWIHSIFHLCIFLRKFIAIFLYFLFCYIGK